MNSANINSHTRNGRVQKASYQTNIIQSAAKVHHVIYIALHTLVDLATRVQSLWFALQERVTARKLCIVERNRSQPRGWIVQQM